MNLTLDPEECEALGVMLESYVSDLRLEIAGTDRRRMRDELKRREHELRSIQRKLQLLTSVQVGPEV